MSAIGERARRLARRFTGRGGRCVHRNQVVEGVERGSDGCESCRAAGMRWVHLRMCLICGNVGCCMASQGRHSLAHFDQTGHAIIRSLEPDEDWWYCFAEWKEIEP